MMNKKTSLVAGVVAVTVMVVGGVGVKVWMKTQHTPAIVSTSSETPSRHTPAIERLSLETPEERKKAREHAIQKWQSSEAALISLPNLSSLLDKRVQDNSSVQAPPGVIRVANDTLTGEQRGDLVDAIVGLLKSYNQNQAESVFDYMNSRDEQLNPKVGQFYRDSLKEFHHWSQERLANLGDRDTMIEYWKAAKCQTDWDAVIPSESHITLWTSKTLTDDNSAGRHFGRSHDNQVFQNIVSYQHNFSPRSRTLELAFQEDGQVMFADVRLLIKFNTKWSGEPRPHFIRYWYDTKSKKWHPYSLYAICTVSSGYPNLIF